MTNLKINQEKSTSQDSKVPKWLQGPPPGRAFTELDKIEEAARDGEAEVLATDVARHRPSHRWKTYKKVNRRIAEMEEMHEWIRKKAEKNEDQASQYLDQLEEALNSTIR